ECECLVCGRVNEYWYKDIKKGVGSKHFMCSSRIEKDLIFFKLRNTHSKMKDRCDNVLNKRHPLYGRRGIIHDFEHFIDFYDYTKPLLLDAMNHTEPDMFKLSLDRIDNNSGYSRGNLRFATQKTQVNNSSIILNRIITFHNRKTNETIVFKGKTVEHIAKTMMWTEKLTRSRISEKKYYEWTIITERCND
ncbi:MAG: hypothetical protein ACRC5T_01595, partial [Cetobacterium sp.]